MGIEAANDSIQKDKTCVCLGGVYRFH